MADESRAHTGFVLTFHDKRSTVKLKTTNGQGSLVRQIRRRLDRHVELWIL